MNREQWLGAWRAWLRARFPTLDADTLEAAAAECEVLRSVWGPLLELETDNGELPFPHALPPRGGQEPV